MVKFGTQLALNSSGFVSASDCTKDDGPFHCKICSNELRLRAGKKQPAHFIHQVKSDCEGNTDEDREKAKNLKNIEETVNIYDHMENILENAISEPNDMIKELAEEVIQDLVNDNETHMKKCTTCKEQKPNCSPLFSDTMIEQFKLNNLQICSSCRITCKKCNGINSKKNEKRYGSCFECEDVRSSWEQSSEEVLDNIGNEIPECPEWLNEKKQEFVKRLNTRRMMGKRVYNFMFKNKDYLSEYRKTMKSTFEERRLMNYVIKMRKDDKKERKRRQTARDRSNGPVATERYQKMFMNKTETCKECGIQGKRRHFEQFYSTMGSIKWSCMKCVKHCKWCKDSTITRDLDKYSQLCFECASWCVDKERWVKNYMKIVKSAASGDKESCYILFRNSPVVEKGKFSGERISNLPDTEIESISRKTPELQEMCKAIITCRRN